jgi:hypothetical protein
MMGFCVFLAFMAAPAAAQRRAAAAPTFSPAAWRHAPLSGKGWSRESMIAAFEASLDLEHATRAQMLAALGPPGFVADSYAAGTGRQSRVDLWRLSAANDRAYAVRYDALDRVVSHDVSDESGCACTMCDAAAPAAPLAAFQRDVLDENAARHGPSLSLAAAAARLGRPGKRSIDESFAGGRMWVYYADVWRDAADRNRYLIGSGHTPKSDVKQDALDALIIDSYDVITVLPECLAP